MNTLFAPGCALLLYNPKLAAAAHAILNSTFGDMAMLRTCCRHHPDVPVGTRIINVCPGCDRRYREENAAASTVSLWEVLAASDRFPFPDYARKRMTIIDACPTRDQDRIHDAIRALASRLNIELIEPTQTRRTSTCCGDILYGELPTRQVVAQMKRKAAEMPEDDIIVYCVSCATAMIVGERQPRYMLDLLFGEETVPKTDEPDAWHRELDGFIESHSIYETSPSFVRGCPDRPHHPSGGVTTSKSRTIDSLIR